MRIAAPESVVSSLISRILSVTLVSGRPLHYYTCTFLLPLDLSLDEELDAVKKTILPEEKELEGRDIELHQIAKDPSGVLSAHIGQQQRDPENPIDMGEEEAEAQALLYFTPPIQRFVFHLEDGGDSREDEVIQPVKHWRLKSGKTEGLTLSLQDISLDEERIAPLKQRRARVKDLSLYQYYNGLYLLALRVEIAKQALDPAQKLGLFGEGNSWWQALFKALPEDFELIQGLQAEAWLHFTKSARLLRPAFPQEMEEGKINRIVLEEQGDCLASFTYKNDFSPVVLDLIERFTGKDPLTDRRRLLHVRDDRMFVNVAYGLTGPEPGTDPEAQNAFERLFSLALNVDRGKDGFAGQEGYAYDRDFARQQLERQAYKRWQGIGVLSGYTYWSNVFMGYGRQFNTHIAPVHVPYLYGRMLMLALFYQASLYHYERRVTLSTSQLVQAGSEDFDPHKQTFAFRKLRRDFIEFTNNYWFKEVTAQTQGDEIFRLQTAALALEEKYALIKDEMERADEYIEAQRQAWVAKKANQIGEQANQFSKTALYLAIAAIVITIGAIIVSALQIEPMGNDFNWCWPSRFSTAFAITAGVLFVAFEILLISWVKSRKWPYIVGLLAACGLTITWLHIRECVRLIEL